MHQTFVYEYDFYARLVSVNIVGITGGVLGFMIVMATDFADGLPLHEQMIGGYIAGCALGALILLGLWCVGYLSKGREVYHDQELLEDLRYLGDEKMKEATAKYKRQLIFWNPVTWPFSLGWTVLRGVWFLLVHPRDVSNFIRSGGRL